MDPTHITMMMTRRDLLRGALLLVGGAASACATGPIDLWGDKPTTTRFFNDIEFALLDEVCEIIMPQTDTPGARGAGVPGAIDALMRSWASPQRQQQFRALLKDFDAAAVAEAGKPLLELAPSQRFDVIAHYDAAHFRQSMTTPLKDQKPYPAFKNLVLRLYYMSEVGATQELRYEHVPGAWEPAVKVTADTRAWAYPNG
jgi:gluconate 2-dehydrogenase gamma chain